MRYEDIPVFRDGLPGVLIGKATVETDEAGVTEIHVQTVTEDFTEFLKKGTLRGISLNAQVIFDD